VGGFVAINMVTHEGTDGIGEQAHTLTVADIATV